MTDVGLSAHGNAAPRGLVAAGGRYGRLFPALPDRGPPTAILDQLEAHMSALPAQLPALNGNLRAGDTYFGQFIDHDLTFDALSRLDRRNDLATLRNFRTPSLDLDSVYGSGPADQPFLYDWKDPEPHGVRLLIGGHDGIADLPRNDDERALLGDARNDENLIVSQLHLLFLRFHNRIVDALAGPRWPDPWELFDEAQRLVRWHYQWIVVHDFLERLVGTTIAHDVLRPAPPGGSPRVNLQYFIPGEDPAMPVEFSAAAYRFGHSMVRADYMLQPQGRTSSLFKRTTGNGLHLGGFRPLPAEQVIDWDWLLTQVLSMRIDTNVVGPLWALPPDKTPLARLNLRRGRDLGLPSGPDVAAAMNLTPLDAKALRVDTLPPPTRDVLVRATPLWYYVLCEARADRDDGQRLGPVGGRIVAETLVGLLQSDPRSYLRQRPRWQPGQDNLLGITNPFTLKDLARIAERRS